MNGCDLATMHEPLKRSRMDLEHGRRLMTVEQWLPVDSGAAICSYTRRCFFSSDMMTPFCTPMLPWLSYKRGSRFVSQSSNEI